MFFARRFFCGGRDRRGGAPLASAPAAPPPTTFAAAGAQAVSTLLTTYYAGNGLWNECDKPGFNRQSSSGRSIPGTVLFAWRWPRRGPHTIRFAPGVANGKEGGSFLHLQAYLVG